MNDLAGIAPEPLLDVSDLTIAYGGGVLAAPKRTIVRDVSFRIERGEIFALVGESGSGKSTILRAIAGIAPVGRGQIRFMGEDITHLGRRRRRPFAARLQMVFQDPYASLDPKMTVGLSAAEPLGAAAPELSRDERRQRAAAAFAEVGLDRSALDRYPHEFSGGQRQRIAIARALITSPELLLLDEPVSALDVSVRAQVLNLLLDLRRSRGLSYLFVSHDLAVVRLIADRVAVLSAGKIVETGAAADVIDRPSHPYTRALRAAVPSPIVRGAHR